MGRSELKELGMTGLMIGDDGQVSVRAPLLCLNHFVR